MNEWLNQPSRAHRQIINNVINWPKSFWIGSLVGCWWSRCPFYEPLEEINRKSAMIPLMWGYFRVNLSNWVKGRHGKYILLGSIISFCSGNKQKKYQALARLTVDMTNILSSIFVWLIVGNLSFRFQHSIHCIREKLCCCQPMGTAPDGYFL